MRRRRGGGGGEGEVFVPPYKSQYPLVSAVVRERRSRGDGKGRLKVREREAKGGRWGNGAAASREWNMKIFGIWTEFAAFPQPRQLCSSYEQKTPAKLCSPR